MRSLGSLVVAVLAAVIGAGAPARAQTAGGSFYEPPSGASATPATRMPDLLVGIGLDQRLGQKIPLDLTFVDEHGRTVKLADFFGRRPVILTLVYYECPMLCTQVLNGLATSIRPLQFDVGREYEIVTISFNPRDTPELARAKKASYIEAYNRPGAAEGWHFLTGAPSSIDALTGAVGFRYTYDPTSAQYAHASGIMVLTPDGTLSKYFYGIEYWPRDVRFALMEASDRKIGTVIDQLLLPCFHYDPKSARYSVAVMRLVRSAGIATLLALVSGIVVMRRRDKTATNGPLGPVKRQS
jgi:protein SCO1/2